MSCEDGERVYADLVGTPNSVNRSILKYRYRSLVLKASFLLDIYEAVMTHADPHNHMTIRRQQSACSASYPSTRMNRVYSAPTPPP